MKDKVKIVMVGGGSFTWTTTLINDLLLTPSINDAVYTVLDINEEAGTKMAQFGNMLAGQKGLKAVFEFTNDSRTAYTGADYVIITISTGGLDAMEHDLKIPEDYKIYQTVGDTVGPGGWARSLRNIPVFAQIAKSIEQFAPNAIVLNYTNPMAELTKVFYKVSSLKAVGLCHGLFEMYAMLINMFKLKGEEEIKVRFGGINHFFWILDMKIRGEDGYRLLREKRKNKSLAELIDETYVDGAGYSSNNIVCEELFDYFGYLPYNGDRHICEFVPWYVTKDQDIMKKYGLRRTFTRHRRDKYDKDKKHLDELLKGNEKMTKERSRETAADIINAFVSNTEFIDVVNVPNEGQISNLPKGSIVETLGVINSRGFTPVTAGDLPEQILNIILPHVKNQNMIVEAGLDGDLNKALYALYNDPLCSHLTLPEIKEMGLKLLKANKKYLPQFSL